MNNQIKTIGAAIALAGLGIAPGAGAQGKLSTLPQGTYTCSMPGNAASAAWREMPGRTFTIANSSTYSTADGAGTYLLSGSTVRFTRGPMKGMQFKLTGTSTLVLLEDDGSASKVRCVRG